MKLIKLTVTTTPAASEAVINVLMEHGAGGVQQNDVASGVQEVITYFAPDQIDEKTVQAIEAKVKGLAQFGLDVGAGRITLADNDSSSWQDNWKQYFHVSHITNRTTIVPSWQDDYQAKPGEITLKLDPQKAFGTGTHPTTSLMIALMEQVIIDQQSLMDVGTGSGVLAIMAKKLGVSDVWAADISDDAIVASQANFAQNGVATEISLHKNDLLTNVCQTADVIVANILPEFLVPLIDQIDEHLNPKGTVLLSGIIVKASPQVEAALQKNGFVVVEKIIRNQWVALMAKRSSECDDAFDETVGG